MQPIIERFTTQGKVVENKKDALPPKTLCRAQYEICTVGKKNRNNRIYEKSVWEGVLNNPEIKEKLANKSMFFHAEHPTTTQSSGEKIAGVVTGIHIDENTGKVSATMDVLETPYGQIVDTLLQAGCGIGVSTRADGELEEAVDESGQRYSRVVPESYRFVTVDFTADPSNFGSELPLNVQRNVSNAIKHGLDNEKIDRHYATMLLETLKCDEATSILESLKIDKHHDGCKCKPTEKKCNNCSHNNNSAEQTLLTPVMPKEDTKTKTETPSEAIYVSGMHVKVSERNGVIAHVFPRSQKCIVQFADTKETVSFSKIDRVEVEIDESKTDIKPLSKVELRCQCGALLEFKHGRTDKYGYECKVCAAKKPNTNRVNVGIKCSTCGSHMISYKGRVMCTECKTKKSVIESKVNEVEFTSLDSVLTNKDGMSLEDVIAAVKLSITSEYDATELYKKIAAATDNDMAKRVMQSVADEESVHAGEFRKLLATLDPKEEEKQQEGEKEVTDKVMPTESKIKEAVKCPTCQGDMIGYNDTVICPKCTNIGAEGEAQLPNSDPATQPEAPLPVAEEVVNEYIKKVGGEYQVTSHKGKNLGRYKSKAEAEKRLKQVEFFKHKNEATGEPIVKSGDKVKYQGKEYVIKQVYPEDMIVTLEDGQNVDVSQIEDFIHTQTPDKAEYAGIKKTVKEDLDPKFFQSKAHKQEHVKGVWWYNIKSGELRFSKDKPHKDEQFKDIQHKPGWIKGRTFEHNGEIFLMIYGSDARKLRSNDLTDLVHKLDGKMGTKIDYIIDDNGKDLSQEWNKLDGDVKEKFNIKTFRYVKEDVTDVQCRDCGYMSRLTAFSRDQFNKTICPVCKSTKLKWVHDDIPLMQEAAMTNNEPQILQFLKDNWNVFIDDQDKIDNLVRLFKLDAGKAKQYVDQIEQEKFAVKNQYAMAEAALQEKVSNLTAVIEAFQESQAQSAKDSVYYIDEIKKLRKNVDALREIRDQNCKKMNELYVEIKSLQEANQSLAKEHEKQVMQLKEQHKSEVIKSYVDARTKALRLNLAPKALTILESCDSREEVEARIKQIQDHIREGLLQSNIPSILEVKNNAPVDPKLLDISNKVAKAFESFGA